MQRDRAVRGWPAGLNRIWRLSRRKIAILWLVSLGLCMMWNSYRSLVVNSYVLGYDNNFYFAWARSIVIDGDVEFTNDLEFVATNERLGETQKTIAKYLDTVQRTSNGYVPNKYGIGMALTALPPLYLTRMAANLCTLISGHEVSGFSRIYPWIFTLNSIFYGFLGLAVSYRLLEPAYGRSTAFISVALGVLGLPLGYYIWYEPTMSHAVSFGMITLFLLVSIRWREKLREHFHNIAIAPLLPEAVVMGFLLGISCSIRYTNALFAMVPFVFALKDWNDRGRSGTANCLKAGFVCLIAALSGTLIGFLPQLVAWKQVYGCWVVYPYQGEVMLPWPRYFFEVLFGLRNSLFVWTPLALAAMAGLFLAAFRRDILALSGILVILGLVWIYGSWECYWLGNSYGMRGLVDASFFFLLGFAEIIMLLRRPSKSLLLKRMAATGIVLLVVWNIYFIFCYRSGLQPNGCPFAGLKLLSDPGKPLGQFNSEFNFIYLLGKLDKRPEPSHVPGPQEHPWRRE